MKTGRKKLLLAVVVLVVLVSVVTVSIRRAHGEVTAVQTAQAQRRDVTALVTASGEITPKNYADISANNIGRITRLLVKEGDHVSKGQLLALQDNVQEGADVAAMQASLKTSEAMYQAQQAGLVTNKAEVQSDKATLDQATQDWQRAQHLYEAQLISKADYQTKKAAFETATAQYRLAQAKVTQAEATLRSNAAGIAQSKANLARASDVLSKTEFRSPLDGIVTYLPIHVGETVVMGIQNQPGSVIMRVADMSLVTAELQVDESDIVNVKLGQPVDLTIDAYGDHKYHGTVTEVGDTAILSSTGQAASSSQGQANQGAKNFKVVVTMTDPPPTIRPGLSCTGKITTAVAPNALSIPIQAVVERDPSQLNPPKKGEAQAAALAAKPDQKPEQGVFVIRNNEAVFVPVTTGVTGVDHVQVQSGLQPGDQVVTGPYKALRTMKNHSRIKVDNTVIKPPTAA